MSRVVISKLIAGVEVILSLVTYLPMLSTANPNRESLHQPIAAATSAEQDLVAIGVVEIRSPFE